MPEINRSNTYSVTHTIRINNSPEVCLKSGKRSFVSIFSFNSASAAFNAPAISCWLSASPSLTVLQLGSNIWDMMLRTRDIDPHFLNSPSQEMAIICISHVTENDYLWYIPYSYHCVQMQTYILRFLVYPLGRITFPVLHWLNFDRLHIR